MQASSFFGNKSKIHEEQYSHGLPWSSDFLYPQANTERRKRSSVKDEVFKYLVTNVPLFLDIYFLIHIQVQY